MRRLSRLLWGARRYLRWAAAVALALAWTAIPLRIAVMAWAAPRIAAVPERAPSTRVAIVFGAAVRGNTPSAVLYDRVAAAVDLYRAGKVDRLLMSGDNRFADYNEPAVMKGTAIQLGVPASDIAEDFAGRSTYDTCYRARAVFGLSEAVLVTQRFHLSRALWLCDALGVNASGYSADQRAYPGQWINEAREVAATANAAIELGITRPVPVLGPPLPIP